MDNIRRQQMGARFASGPGRYATNEIPPKGEGTFSMVVIPPEARAAAETATRGPPRLASTRDANRRRPTRSFAGRPAAPPPGSSAPISRAPGKYVFEDLYMGLRAGGHLEAATRTAVTDDAAAPIDKLLAELKAACEGNTEEADLVGSVFARATVTLAASSAVL